MAFPYRLAGLIKAGKVVCPARRAWHPATGATSESLKNELQFTL